MAICLSRQPKLLKFLTETNRPTISLHTMFAKHIITSLVLSTIFASSLYAQANDLAGQSKQEAYSVEARELMSSAEEVTFSPVGETIQFHSQPSDVVDLKDEDNDAKTEPSDKPIKEEQSQKPKPAKSTANTDKALANKIGDPSRERCWAAASRDFGVPLALLYAVALVETNSTSGIKSKANANGSYDIGIMQINTWWLPMLEKRGITEKALLKNTCLNIRTGAAILKDSIARHGLNWKGVGAYNAATDSKRKIYAKKVLEKLSQIKNR